MVNQLGKFVPHLAEKSKLIRDLLSTKNEFLWGATQQDAFEKLKKELTSTPVLAHYDPAEKNNPVGRCFILWTRRSAPTRIRKRSKETTSVCVKIHDKYQAKVCLN